MSDRCGARSMIGCWHDETVCLFVCLSVALRIGVGVESLCRHVPIGDIPILISGHFTVGCISFSHNTQHKTEPPKLPRLE